MLIAIGIIIVISFFIIYNPIYKIAAAVVLLAIVMHLVCALPVSMVQTPTQEDSK